MESGSNTAVITDECKMPQAKKGFGVCSLGRCQGRGVRMCLKADSKEVGRRIRCWIPGPTMEYRASTIHDEK